MLVEPFFIGLFLPISLLCFWFLNEFSTKFSEIFLLIISLGFLAVESLESLPWLVLSIFVNFLFSILLFEIKEFAVKRLIFFIALFLNISYLIYFKYFNEYFPLAISFYTITQLVFLKDLYDELINRSNYSCRNHFLFVSLYPQLISGPIVQFRDLIDKLDKRKVFDQELFSFGILLTAIGLFKKLVVAPNFIFYDSGFTSSNDILSSVLTILGSTFYLYFDFSAYSDIAIGICALYGFIIPINFNRPFLACNISEFWSRWHMTLSNVINTYLFIPLIKHFGFGAGVVCASLCITMIISGIWHGNSEKFILWGFVHGLALIIHHLWRQIGHSLPAFIGRLMTFCFVSLSLSFFMAPSVAGWLDFMRLFMGFIADGLLFDFSTGLIGGRAAAISVFIACISMFFLSSQDIAHKYKNSVGKNYWMIVIGAWLLFLMRGESSEFVYFQF